MKRRPTSSVVLWSLTLLLEKFQRQTWTACPFLRWRIWQQLLGSVRPPYFQKDIQAPTFLRFTQTFQTPTCFVSALNSLQPMILLRICGSSLKTSMNKITADVPVQRKPQVFDLVSDIMQLNFQGLEGQVVTNSPQYASSLAAFAAWYTLVSLSLQQLIL